MTDDARAAELAETYRRQMNGGFIALMGTRFVHADGDRIELEVPVTPELHQPYGIVHGGVYSAVVETAASMGAGLWYAGRGEVVGLQNTTHFLRAVRDGTLHAVGTPIHRGRMQQLWLVEITDDAGRLIARGEVRLANLASADGLGRSAASPA
jgi:1,4-dihydroxy-2-naphthoyl-CoA hydrolase